MIRVVTKLERKILDYLNRPAYKPLKEKSLSKKLAVTKKTQTQFRAALYRLLDSDRIREGSNGLLRVPAATGFVEGIIKRTSRGTGYCIPHGPAPTEPREGVAPVVQDVYIVAKDMRDAHTGDEVLVRLLKRRRSGGQRCGRIEEVLQRATHTFVGTYFEYSGQGHVQVDGPTFNKPILVGDSGVKNAQPDDKVVIEMFRFPSHCRMGEGVLTRVLGRRGDSGVDIQSIICEFDLPDEFPDDVIEEARFQASRFHESNLDGRLDLTNEIIVTIDPKGARDFDDAISLTRTDQGNWRLGVHIADVSHFVPSDSVLDREALKRGNSVYLPGHVLPMLPELISNGVASLQQEKVRYTKSVFIEFTTDGVPVDTTFANSAIKVTRRFVYEQVLPIIRDPDRSGKRVSVAVRALLADMHQLAMVLRKRRFEAGALELNLPEVTIEFDKDGRVAGAHQVEHGESHQMVEEFMLAANIAVATELDDCGMPFLQRVHDRPTLSKLRAFAEFVSVLGCRLKRIQSRHSLQELLNHAKGEVFEQAVNYALLRSMKQAQYTGMNIGHYALAVEHYCHFTSPIRRYPDLTVHRLIDQIIMRRRRLCGPSQAELTKLGSHCLSTERRADAAERELTKIKLLTFMIDSVGEELEATITGVERFGIFCLGIKIPIEGLVHISWLSEDDNFYYEASTISLIGQRSGRRYRLGDRVRVKVARVDVDRRILDFRIVSNSWPRTSENPKRTKTTVQQKQSRLRRSAPGSRKRSKRKTAEKTGRQ